MQACATVRSQRSGKKDPDLAATAKALQAAAKAGRPFSSHIKGKSCGRQCSRQATGLQAKVSQPGSSWPGHRGYALARAAQRQQPFHL